MWKSIIYLSAIKISFSSNFYVQQQSVLTFNISAQSSDQRLLN